MLRRLFEPSQLRDCRFALRQYRQRFDTELSWAEIESKVANSLNYERETVRSRMIMQGHTAKNVVGDMIALTCLNDIEIGLDHVYRGVLSQRGQSKRSIFAGVITDQFAEGWISASELGIANENMKSAVAGAG